MERLSNFIVKLKCLLLVASLVALVTASTYEEAAKIFPLILKKNCFVWLMEKSKTSWIFHFDKLVSVESKFFHGPDLTVMLGTDASKDLIPH